MTPADLPTTIYLPTDPPLDGGASLAAWAEARRPPERAPTLLWAGDHWEVLIDPLASEAPRGEAPRDRKEAAAMP